MRLSGCGDQCPKTDRSVLSRQSMEMQPTQMELILQSIATLRRPSSSRRSDKPEFRSWTIFHGEFLPVFVFKWQAADATSAKLRCRKLRHFPATGCAVAGRPKKTTDGALNGGPRDRGEPRKGTLACATWRAGDRWPGRQRAEIPQAN